MENQVNTGDQNTQQIGQNPVNQPVTVPEKPKLNPWTISTIILGLILAFLSVNYFVLLQTYKKSNNFESAVEREIPTPTQEPVAPMAQSSPQNTKVEVDPGTGWYILKSDDVGISFKFPPLSGAISYEFNNWPKRDFDPTGILYWWELTEGKTKYTYAFAGGVSQDMVVGRSGWITDNYRWIQEGNDYYVEQSRGYKFKVQPIKIVNHSQGTKGIIFNDKDYWGTYGKEFLENIGFNNTKGKVAVLNFPEGYHSELKSITFYFKNEVSTEEVEKVILSLEFIKK